MIRHSLQPRSYSVARRPRPLLELLEARCVPAITAGDDLLSIARPEAALDVLANDTISDGSGLQIDSVSAVSPVGPTLFRGPDSPLLFGHAAPGTYTFGYTVSGKQHWLTPELGGMPEDHFGSSVAIDGDTVVIGAPQEDVGFEVDQGAVWVFVRNGARWDFQARLLAPFGTTADGFGWSVAIAGDTLVAGAIGHDVGGNSGQGAAFVFVRSGSTWTVQSELTASDGSVGDAFGNSVAISGDTVVVGALFDTVGGNSKQGSAYVFARSGTSWSEQAHLIASDGSAMDTFANRVAISGDSVVVGAFQDAVGGSTQQGSAYVFARSGTSWSEQAHLTASDGASGDNFGSGVGISGDTVVIGAMTDDVGSNVNQGSAYVFVRSGSTWSEQAHLTASDGSTNDSFGASVAIDGDRLIAGARLDNVGTILGQGSAYVFARSGTTWTEQKHLVLDPDAERFDDSTFGSSVAISGPTTAVGAPTETVGLYTRRGSVYVQNASPSDTATVTVTVNAWPTEPVLDTQATAGPFQPFGTDTAEARVASWYRTILGRDPDALGLSAWANDLRTGTDPGNVVAGIWASLEHRQNQVRSFYQGFLGRTADADGLNDWVAAFTAGHDEEDVVYGFLLSQEYRNLHPSDAAFVAALYEDLLQRAGSSFEIQNWVYFLSGGTRQDFVIQQILDGEERRTDSLDNLYSSFLLRLADRGGIGNGFDYWMGELTSGRVDLDDVARAVLASTEFASYVGLGP